MTAPMPEDRLAEIEQRVQAATPGPWSRAHAPAEGSTETHAEYLAKSLSGLDPQLHVVIAPSPDSAIGVAIVTPLGSNPPVLHGASVEPGYSTPYATVQDAQQRAMSTATVCLLVPVDADGNLL